MKKNIVITIGFCMLTIFSYGQSTNESFNYELYIKSQLIIEADYFNVFKIFNSEKNYKFSDWGVSKELKELVTVSPEAKKYINNVNANLITGYVIEFISWGCAGFLFTASIHSNTQQEKIFYSASWVGSILVGYLIGNIFTNNGYDNLFKAVNSYNKYLLIRFN